MTHLILMILILIGAFLEPRPGLPCTGFYMNSEKGYVCARSFDWPEGEGLIFINKKGVKKTAMTSLLNDRPAAEWISTYGSVTINQVGCDLPNFGVNEAGLVVQGFIFSRAKYPTKPDTRPIVGQTQWKQYLLDNCATIEDVLDACAKVRIHSPTGRFGQHYLICDKSGDCIVIEYIGGETVVYSKNRVSVRAFVDTYTYDECLNHLKKHRGFGGTEPLPASVRGIDRFVRAAKRMQTFGQQNSSRVDYVFGMLDDVKIGTYTKWQIVFDSETRRLLYRTTRNPTVRFIDVSQIDFSCENPIQVVDVEHVEKGKVNGHLVPYSKSTGAGLLKHINQLYRLPAHYIDIIAGYPDHFDCQAHR